MQKIPPRHRRAALSDEIRSKIPVAHTYQMYPSQESDEQLSLLEKTLQRLKSFLWFLTKLDWTQFLHFMNDACLRPMRSEKLKAKADFPTNQNDHGSSFSEPALVTTKTADHKNKKRRFRRSKTA